jgi:glycosyltransferase involved in cell wall biosynthesis
VVIPSFNQAAFLGKAIRSVLDQRYPRVELVVADGGSSDGSRDVIERHVPSLTWWCSEPDKGQANALNKGFARTSGDIMAWLNSDDRLAPGALFRVAAFFSKRPDVEAVYGQRILIDEADRDIGRWILPPHDGRALRWVDYVPQETLYWRRDLWKRTGGALDERYHFALDWDLLLRFRRAGAKMVRLPFFLGLFRVHAAQKTMDSIEATGFREMQALRERTLGFPPSPRRVGMAVVWYLLKARFCESMWKIGVWAYE